MLTNYIISFEQLGPDKKKILRKFHRILQFSVFI